MPIRGFVRMRRHQFGKQSDLLTPAAATRRVGARGVPTINPNWTDVEDVDTGSIDPILPPYRMALEVTQPLAWNPLNFNDIPLIMSALIAGGVTPTPGTTTAQTWEHQSVSKAATVLDYYTDEFADDVNKNDDTIEDGTQLIGGMIQRFEATFGADLGPWQVNTDWIFAHAKTAETPTPGLVLPADPVWAYGEDTALYLDDTHTGIGTTKIADSLIGATIVIENEVDEKRFANGLPADPADRYQVDGLGIAGRTITATFRFEKTAQTIWEAPGESSHVMAADPVYRYARLETKSVKEAEAGVPFSWVQDFSGTWRQRTEAEEGGNAVIELEMTGRLDEDLGFAYKSTTVNDQATTP